MYKRQNYALARRGLPTHPVKSYYTFVGNGIPKLIERASGIPQGEPGYQEIYDGFMEYYDAHSTDKTVVYDGMPEVVQQINRRGILCAVLSNNCLLYTSTGPQEGIDSPAAFACPKVSTNRSI